MPNFREGQQVSRYWSFYCVQSYSIRSWERTEPNCWSNVKSCHGTESMVNFSWQYSGSKPSETFTYYFSLLMQRNDGTDDLCITVYFINRTDMNLVAKNKECLHYFDTSITKRKCKIVKYQGLILIAPTFFLNFR